MNVQYLSGEFITSTFNFNFDIASFLLLGVLFVVTRVLQEGMSAVSQ